MKKLLLSVLLVYPIGLFAQSVSQYCPPTATYASNPSSNCVFGSNVTSGQIVLFYEFESGGLTLQAPTKTAGTATIGTLTAVGTPANNQAVYVASVTGTGSLTITGSATGGTNTFAVSGYALASTSTTTDGTPSYVAYSYCGSCTGPTTTTSASGDMVITFWSSSVGPSTTRTPGANQYSEIDFSTYPSSDYYESGGSYVQTTAGQIGEVWTNGSGNNGYAVIVALKSSVPAPNASLSTSTLTFSSLNMNTTSASQSVTLTNSGTATLDITSILLTTGTQFALTNGSPSCPVGSGGGTVAASGTCVVNVTCTPLGVGTITDTITFTYSNNSPSTQTVSLTCTGAQPYAYRTNMTPISGQRSSAPNTLQVMGSGTRIGSTVPGQIAKWNAIEAPSGALTFTTVQHVDNFTCTGTGTVNCSATVASTTAGNLGLIGINIKYTGTGFATSNWAVYVKDNGTAELWNCNISSIVNNNTLGSGTNYDMQYCYVPSLAGGATTVTATASLAGLTGSPAGKINVRFLEAHPSYTPIYYNLGTSLYSNTACTACVGPSQLFAGGASGIISQSVIFPAASVASVNSPYTNFDQDAGNDLYSGFADSLTNTSWVSATWNEGSSHNPNYFSAIAFTANASPAVSVPVYQNYSTCTNGTAVSSELSCLTSSIFSNYSTTISGTGSVGSGMTTCNSTLTDALPSTVNAGGTLYSGTDSGTLNLCGTTNGSGTGIGDYTLGMNLSVPVFTFGFTGQSSCPTSATDCALLSRLQAGGSTDDYIGPHLSPAGHSAIICADVPVGLCPIVPNVTYAPNTAWRFNSQIDSRPPYNYGTGTFTSSNPTIALLNNFPTGQAVQLSGSLPTGFSASTTYYVINPTSTTIQLSATSGGSAITPTSSASPTVVFEPTNILVVCTPGPGGAVLGTISNIALASSISEIIDSAVIGITGEEPSTSGYTYVERDFTYGFPLSTSQCY
jgi:hypothetical protein